MNKLPLIPVLIIAAIFVFNLYWLLRSPNKGGWMMLKDAYATKEPPMGEEFFSQSGKIGSVEYRGLLTIHKAPKGLYISALFLPSTLFIPWTDIYNVKKQRILWHTYIYCEVGLPCIATIRLPQKVFDERFKA